MNFLYIDLCKELQATGIVNESGFVWVQPLTTETATKKASFDGDPIVVHEQDDRFNYKVLCPAYVAEIAFLGPSDTAKENCKKWVGDSWDGDENRMAPFQWFKNALNNLDTTKKSVEDFLRRTRTK